ncbi:Gti1/Pac2 family-domain-containing protein [Crassisporium funariophilum]|nr:Gti1/Pac2 family-domain-containing protein [Crassisporium funariophilum]
MSTGQQASNQQSSSTWTEPPWSGWIETTGDALLILEAARRGLIPRVTRRLVDSERKMITSGSVFVFDEDESGIKRWTDGFFWSPSRILGNFLLYRETDKRGAGHRSGRADSDMNDMANYTTEVVKVEGQSLSRPKTDNGSIGVDKHRERTLMGSLTNSYKFKPDGLMKKTFSLTIGGVAQHLISYYKIEDVENGRLRAPSSLPELASLDISPEYLDKTHFRNPPKVEIGVDGVPRYRGEADDIESSPSILTAPLSSGMPLLTEGRVTEGSANKRGKRYDPYGSPPTAKRARKNTKSSQPDNSTPTAESISPQPSTSSATPQPAPPVYPDPNVPINMGPPPPGPYPPYGVPAFFPVSGYPPPPPPPGHMYHPPPPPPPQMSYAPGPGNASPQMPQQGVVQYAYAGYPQHGSDPSQSGQGPHPYYPYYPPPPHGYPYQWPPYTGYPPQPHPQPIQHPPPPSVVPAAQPKPGAGSENSGEGGEGT